MNAYELDCMGVEVQRQVRLDDGKAGAKLSFSIPDWTGEDDAEPIAESHCCLD
jgi:hypothetical protein